MDGVVRGWLTRFPRAVAVLAAVAAVGGGVAGAQEGPGSTTSTTSTTLIFLPGPPGATTTTQPGDGATTTTDPNAPPPEEQEVGSDEPPPEGVVVPEPAAPPPPPSNAPQFTAELNRQLKVAQKFSRSADASLAGISARAEALQTQLASLGQMLRNMEVEHGRVIRRLTAARNRLRDRAVGAYTGNEISTLNHILSSGDVNELIRRTSMVESVLRESKRVVREYQAAKKAAGDTINRLMGQIQGTEAELALVQLDLQAAYGSALDARLQVESLAAGSAIAIKGFVFPVAAEARFGNDFGAPRMVGTQFEHSHQGNDIFAAYGAPLVACERGVVTRIGTDRLGGTKLWLVGQSGTRYYYAHLSAFAEGLTEGLVVESGTLLGYVGDSGNARGTSPHLHFEVHPGGGPAVNPYFLLRAATKVGAVAAPPPTNAPPPSRSAQ